MRKEDMVSVDAMHLRATAKWPGGFFASYHAYPYYPDFMRLQPSYRRAEDPYEAYLKELRAHHRGQAVMITEFGVPTGIGSAHLGPLGRDQGDHSEQEAGRMDADLLAAIRRQGMAGGLLFDYTDEWFKHTWNTMDMEQPEDRRPLWQNALTNEEQFGIVAAEAGKTAIVTADGSDREWTRTQSQQIYEGGGTVKEVRAIHDANWLYLLVRRDGDTPVQLGFDVRPGGNEGLPGRPGVDPEADVAISLGPGRKAALREAASSDPIAFLYGLERPYVPVRRADLEPGSGAWVRPRLMLNRPYTVPHTGEKRPTELLDISALRWGTADPKAAAFDDRVTVSGGEDVLELRIPWAMLTFTDPSSHRVWVPKADGSVDTLEVGRLGIAVAPSGEPAVATNGYGWDEWNRVDHHERRKAGWPSVRRAMQVSALAR